MQELMRYKDIEREISRTLSRIIREYRSEGYPKSLLIVVKNEVWDEIDKLSYETLKGLTDEDIIDMFDMHMSQQSKI